MARPSRYDADFREHAVRLVLRQRNEYATEFEAIKSIATELGIGSPDTLRKWVRRAEVDSGAAPARTTAEHEKIDTLQREDTKLRRAKETPEDETDFEGPPVRPGVRPILFDAIAAVFAAVALVVSILGYLIADRADERQAKAEEQQRLREETEYAQQVVFSAVDQVTPGFGGAKPSIDGYTIVVVNFGSFPIEDVVIEGVKETLEWEGDDLVRPMEFIPAINIGTIGPCRVATYETSERFERVVFIDVNGVTWTRMQASPPERTLPDPDVDRSFPDIRQSLPLSVEDLEQCR